MSDKYRILGKYDENSKEPVYILEINVTRTLLFTKIDSTPPMNIIREYNKDGGWDEIINFIESCYSETSIEPQDISLIETPWMDVNFSNDNLLGLLSALKIQQEDFSFYSHGSPETGGMTFSTNIAGRQYNKTIRSSAEANILANNLTAFKAEAITAGVNAGTIKLVEKIIDWALRTYGVYEIAERAWKSAREAYEARREQEKLERESRQKFEREKEAGIERARELDMAERISRTA